jgi:hypothetical protein
MSEQYLSTKSSGIVEFARERLRQVEELGFTKEHDSEHDGSDLVAAAICYIDYALGDMKGYEGDNPPYHWPWGTEDWKPEGSALENIVKGGALLAAAYDRIEGEILNG